MYGATYSEYDSEYSKGDRISGYEGMSVDYMDGDDSDFVLEYGAHYVVELDWQNASEIADGYANILLHVNHKKSVTADASTMVDVSVYYGEVEDEMWYDDWLNKAKPTDDVSVKWSYDGGVLTKATHVG
ncbi:MAG: hypothetical protein K5765_08145, partial [Clostridia bacterium]|nr:hypothetical protein [Clostridia bacterium]